LLKPFGQVEEVLKEIIRCYAREYAIAKLQEQINQFEIKYGLPYDQFYDRVATDELFLAKLNQANLVWELDINAWEYAVEELAVWQQRLAKLSNN